ncbi:hypothetical protein HanRHA438_Chr09g0386581 [Helianthus annuus]|nr:hypothetical protein HanIR_Chr09g0404141 [Helianthus annuus]KAJ0541430.1 hypothetical protein HanHA89_Chr09g0328391 [Helianthus annuus]KAJ0887067.1 hypothetical protein HanRHA438_Chr09g0386581 [Helianthus annuus]
MCSSMAEQPVEQQGARPATAVVPPVPVRHFVPKHNQIALLDETVRGAEDYAQIMQFLRRSRIAYAIFENVQQVNSSIHDFWQTARSVNNTVEATINDTLIVITEDVIHAALHSGALDHGETCYSKLIRERATIAFGYVGRFPSKQLYKGMLMDQWRYFYHVLMQCLAPRKSGMDGMGHNLLSAMIGLTFNQPYNFSLMILRAF